MNLMKYALKHITENQNAIPGNIGYNETEKAACISVNQVICHGIPSKNKVLKSGDIVNIDV